MSLSLYLGQVHNISIFAYPNLLSNERRTCTGESGARGQGTGSANCAVPLEQLGLKNQR